MKDSPSDLLLGAHFSIAGGLHKALEEAKSYECNVLQVFTKNATTWRERKITKKEILKFNEAKGECDISEIAAHASYLINIACGDKKKLALSCKALTQEIVRCGQLGIDYLVLHPGFHMEEGESTGTTRIADNINKIFDDTTGNKTRLLLETTSGQGSSIGYKFEQLSAIMEKITDPSRIGICLDTCHIFAAGYDISTPDGYRDTVRAFDEIIGLKHLYLIHLNDSKKEAGSRLDRHEHIGAGAIGLEAFKLIINDFHFREIPKIIETPKGKTKIKDWDKINLNRLRNLKYR